ncbi:MAG: hypothetical protein M3353_03835 [Actinomycetota bacterium]|nr:hypothetical protein [Actinomycetota bacterium]
MQPDPQDTDEQLAGLDDLPVEQHLPIYEAVHRDLTAALAQSAADPAGEPAGEPADEPADESADAEGAGDADR